MFVCLCLWVGGCLAPPPHQLLKDLVLLSDDRVVAALDVFDQTADGDDLLDTLHRCSTGWRSVYGTTMAVLDGSLRCSLSQGCVYTVAQDHEQPPFVAVVYARLQ